MTATGEQPFDLVVVGGGVNGTGIARDAAGRGWRVLLCERRDLASGTSSASTKLIHGGLRYLEYREFRLVREALREREVLWRIAPHIVWPMRFVLPHHRALRPRWLLRLGLFLYDHLGGRRRLPGTRAVDLARDPAGRPLKPAFRRGFEYSDCWVEDARLVALNALSAAECGAEVLTRTACASARREGALWAVTLRDEETGAERRVAARALVNAAGPWVGAVSHEVVGDDGPAPVRLVQGSHIVVPRIAGQHESYIFQNGDGRVLFAIPYETDFTLIGTTDRDYHGDPGDVRATGEEVAYLCEAASAYLDRPITPGAVVWTYSGVRPLHDETGGAAQAATRDYVLALDAPAGAGALLSIFGGKITTYRRLAEAALDRLAPHLPPAPGRAKGWTGREPLPGGDFPAEGFEDAAAALRRDYPFLPEALARRLLRAYGTRARVLLGRATAMGDLGRDFGAGLTEAELAYLVRHEWARGAEDVVWRRSKLGLRLGADEVARVEAAVREMRSRALAA